MPRPAVRWARRAAVLAVVVLLLPVPWLHVVSDDPLGTAWRLDGRLRVSGEVVDPPGRWSWLAVGRPALVVEVLRDRLVGTPDAPVDLREESVTLTPALAEPAAAAVGLRHAGVDLPLGLLVEASDPLVEGLPERAVITRVGGVEVTDRAAWEQATAQLGATSATVRFETATSGVYEAAWTGEGLPYRVVRTLDTAPASLEARIVFATLERLPVDWFRELSLGSSHGLMVALATYAHATGVDVADGQHVAGTGGIRGDGTVVPIGGLTAKATAARRAGADVLLVPAAQVDLLADLDTGSMEVIPVASLAEAIVALTGSDAPV